MSVFSNCSSSSNNANEPFRQFHYKNTLIQKMSIFNWKSIALYMLQLILNVSRTFHIFFIIHKIIWMFMLIVNVDNTISWKSIFPNWTPESCLILEIYNVMNHVYAQHWISYKFVLTQVAITREFLNHIEMNVNVSANWKCWQWSCL